MTTSEKEKSLITDSKLSLLEQTRFNDEIKFLGEKFFSIEEKMTDR